MMRHGSTLKLPRCPHCSIANPHLAMLWNVDTRDDRLQHKRDWRTYGCQTCGGVVLAVAHASRDSNTYEIHDSWPPLKLIDEAVPERGRSFLEQAIACIHAPSGAVMLTASAVDSFLKEKGLKDGNLYTRIDAAAEKHLITLEMAAWAHEVRLDANNQRHADEDAELPTEADAQKVIDFAIALAQFLFVLPARVARGRAK